MQVRNAGYGAGAQSRWLWRTWDEQSREECLKESNNCGKCYRGITETWREENTDC